MKKFNLTVFVLCVLYTLGARSIAQQITSEAIGPLSGSLGVQVPINPGTPDTVTFIGNVHVVAIVDTAQRTVDYHINLMSVKGTGVNGKYIGNGAVSILDQPMPTTPIGPPSSLTASLTFKANLIPPSPFRAGFTVAGALPISVTITFAADNTLATVTATVGP